MSKFILHTFKVGNFQIACRPSDGHYFRIRFQYVSIYFYISTAICWSILPALIFITSDGLSFDLRDFIISFSFRYVCNGKWDCIGGADEIGCSKYMCPGQYKCANESLCILLHQLCDKTRHCPFGDDEWFCELTCPKNCTCIGLYVNCKNANLTQLPLESLPKETRKLDLTGNLLGPDLRNANFHSFGSMGELILQRNKIEIIKSEKFIHLSNLYKLDLRFNNLKVLESLAFAGQKSI